jgi:uncharacterized protein YdaU (DUF1376 family)
MSSTAPAIPLFGDAYLADTHHLTLEEHGAYLKLLMIAWRMEGCALPDDDARIGQMLGLSRGKWAKLKPVVMAFWTLGETGWTQARLTKERAFVDKKRATNRAAAEARWSGQPIENATNDECERISGRNAPPPPPPQVQKIVEATPQPVVSAVEVRAALDAWNGACGSTGWARVIKFTNARQAALRARLKEDGIDGWTAAITRARASPLLNGQPPPTWFDFDFIVKPGNFAKLIEGKYDRQFSSAANGTSHANGPGRTELAALSFAGLAERENDGPRPETLRRVGPSGGGERSIAGYAG